MESCKSKNKKKLFSLYKIFDYDKQEKISLMHIYKRDLSPIKENYRYCNHKTPYEDNFVKFSNTFV